MPCMHKRFVVWETDVSSELKCSDCGRMFEDYEAIEKARKYAQRKMQNMPLRK